MSTEDMLPILETLDQAGFHALEGGEEQLCTLIRFLNEDPWWNVHNSAQQLKIQIANVITWTKPIGIP